MCAPAAFIVSLADEAVVVEVEDEVAVVALLTVLLLTSELLTGALIELAVGGEECRKLRPALRLKQ